MRVAMFCDTPVYGGGGGIYSHCCSLKSILEEMGIQVDLYSNISYSKIWLLKIYHLKEIKALLKKNDYDYFHVHGFMTLLPWQILNLKKNKKLGAKIVYSPHFHPFYTLRHPKISKIFFVLFSKYVLKNVDKIIASNSEDNVLFLKYNKNCYQIPHWINISEKFFQEKSIEKKNKPQILFVGRNDDNKNLKQLYVLPKDKYNVVCVTNIKPERDDFVFKTNLSYSELIDEYIKSDLLVVSSKYESFSLVALESLCCSTPVLLSDRVRIIDYIKESSGVNVYEFNNDADFLEKVESSVSQCVDFSFVKEFFSTEKAMSRYSKVFN